MDRFQIHISYHAGKTEMTNDAPWKKDSFSSLPLVDVGKLLSGTILTDPEDPAFQVAKKQWNSVFDHITPASIVFCDSTEDVSIMMHWLSDGKLFSIRSNARGGHLWNGYCVREGGHVLDLSRLNAASVEKKKDDVGNSSSSPYCCRIGPGVDQGWANRVMMPYGCMFPTAGDCDQFGMGGFVLSGGFSLFARGHGIAADFLLEATVVLPNGNVVVATEDNEYKDLLWGLRGGGAGNFGIVTEMVMDTFRTPPLVLSMEAYWELPTKEEDTVRLLEVWADVQKGNANPEFGGWLVVLPGKPYTIRLLGIWSGQTLADGWKFWEDFKTRVNLPLLPNSNILELKPHDAVYVHQSTFGGGRDFMGVINSRKVKGASWNDGDLLPSIAHQLSIQSQDENAVYLYIFFGHGGAVYSNDPENTKTAYPARDTPGDFIHFVVPTPAGDLDYAKKQMTEYQAEIFDKKMSQLYHPNHPNSMHPPPDVNVAYYGKGRNDKVYNRLLRLKKKYDPNNLFTTPVTINTQ